MVSNDTTVTCDMYEKAGLGLIEHSCFYMALLFTTCKSSGRIGFEHPPCTRWLILSYNYEDDQPFEAQNESAGD